MLSHTTFAENITNLPHSLHHHLPAVADIDAPGGWGCEAAAGEVKGGTIIPSYSDFISVRIYDIFTGIVPLAIAHVLLSVCWSENK